MFMYFVLVPLDDIEVENITMKSDVVSRKVP